MPHGASAGTLVQRPSHGTAHPATDRANWLQVQALQQIGELFYDRNWSVGTSSNYSVVLESDPLELLITASGKDKGRLTGADFVIVGEDGKALDPSDPKPSAETLLHVVTAGQPGVGAILHTHSVWGTILSDLYHQQGGVRLEGYEMQKGLAGVTTHEQPQWIEIFENTQDIPALAAQVRRRFQDAERPLRYGFLLRRHGLYTWGRDLDEARRHVEVLEFLFEVLGRRLSIAGAIV